MSTLEPQRFGGETVAEALDPVVASEEGALFVDGLGRIVLQNRHHRRFRAAGPPQIDVAAHEVVPDDLTILVDPQYLFNIASGTRVDGGAQEVRNWDSIRGHGEYPREVGDLLSVSDAEVLGRLQWLVNTYAEPQTRMSSISLDLLTLDEDVQAAALNAELGDKLRVTELPPQAPSDTLEVLIEGWQESVSDTAWTLSFNTVAAELYRAWVLGDPAYGLLGETTRLGY